MTTLNTQYQNYLNGNPQANTSYSEWSKAWAMKVKEAMVKDELFDLWDTTLNDGLEDAPYVSDDFQIGPDGAYEHSDRDIDYQEALKQITISLLQCKYNNGDISDIGNEVGIALSKVYQNISESEISQFMSGIHHGLSLNSVSITKSAVRNYEGGC